MSLGLNLFPINHLHYGDGPHSCWGFSHSILTLGSLPWEVGQQINTLAKPLPDRHQITGYLGGRLAEGPSKGDRHYGLFDKDCYGETYKWIAVRDLRPLLAKYWPKHPATAYVVAMPDDDFVVLDWH